MNSSYKYNFFCKNSLFLNETSKIIFFLFSFPKAKSFQKCMLGIGDALTKYQKARELIFVSILNIMWML